MRIFSTQEKPNWWHYLTVKNIHHYLATTPYYQGRQIYALCPYCHNPIQIIIRNQQSSLTTAILYAHHVQKAPEGFLPVNTDRKTHCLLNKASNKLTPSIFGNKDQPSLDRIDLSHLRQAFSSLCGFYFSNQLTQQILNKNKEVLKDQNVDQFNFPFALLANTRKIMLNGRIINNPLLLNKLRQFDALFKINDRSQIIAKNPKSQIWLRFGTPQKDRSQLLWLPVRIMAFSNGYEGFISTHRIYCRMFNDLVK